MIGPSKRCKTTRTVTMSDTINMLCMNCGEPAYLSEEEALNATGCPHCGDQGTPADLDNQVTITLTSHELRILSFWSEGYAKMMAHIGQDPSGRMPKVLKVIRDRLTLQTDTSLSLTQDLADLRQRTTEAFPDDSVEMLIVDGNGTCLECGEHVGFNNDDWYLHHCTPKDLQGIDLHEISLDDLPPLLTTEEMDADGQENQE